MILCRYEAELLRQLHFTPFDEPRDTPPHIIKPKFFCNYCRSLHKLYLDSEKFRNVWNDDGRKRPKPEPDAFYFLVLPKLHTKNLAQLQIASKIQYHSKIRVGMRESLVWKIAGQVILARSV